MIYLICTCGIVAVLASVFVVLALFNGSDDADSGD